MKNQGWIVAQGREEVKNQGWIVAKSWQKWKTISSYHVHRSGPLLDWDPDIVETLDDAFEGHAEVFTAKQLEKLCAEEDGEGGDELDELFKEELADREEDDEYVTDDEVGSPSPF